jgi:hypothetical protein
MSNLPRNLRQQQRRQRRQMSQGIQSNPMARICCRLEKGL